MRARPPGTATHTGRTRQSADAVLFADTFTNYYDPDIGLAAADVLEAAGLRVALGPDACCGRPLISQGLLDAARDRAADAVRRLHPLAAAGTPIVLLEPSCLSALADDVPALLRGEAQRQAREVASGLRPVRGPPEPAARRRRRSRWRSAPAPRRSSSTATATRSPSAW